ncbi:hypothetical protein [Kibdelosporangium philippinense]|uniref:hypothetical protein n=1 Tax=Kibdelosporangium philippinense TaxID=211113 RepID=UPI003607BE18
MPATRSQRGWLPSSAARAFNSPQGMVDTRTSCRFPFAALRGPATANAKWVIP